MESLFSTVHPLFYDCVSHLPSNKKSFALRGHLHNSFFRFYFELQSFQLNLTLQSFLCQCFLSKFKIVMLVFLDTIVCIGYIMQLMIALDSWYSGYLKTILHHNSNQFFYKNDGMFSNQNKDRIQKNHLMNIKSPLDV